MNHIDEFQVLNKSVAVKIYRPDIFSRIRDTVGLSNKDILDCIDPLNLEPIQSESKGGQCLWKSTHGPVILKTLVSNIVS